MKIHIACAILHNRIHMYQYDGSFISQYFQDRVPVSEIDSANTEEDVNQNHNLNRQTEGGRNTTNRIQSEHYMAGSRRK